MTAGLTPEEVARSRADGDQRIVLLDVREADERAYAVIEPSLHIPMNEIPLRQHEIPSGSKVVVYCHTGLRSMIVAAYLEAHGFPDVANLDGGIDAWSSRVDPTVPRY